MTVKTLAQNELGSVKRLCNHKCACTQIHFKNLLWTFSWPQIEPLSNYVDYLLTTEGFLDNQFDQERTVVLMEEHMMSALMNHEELAQFQTLLETARIEHTRQHLMDHHSPIRP